MGQRDGLFPLILDLGLCQKQGARLLMRVIGGHTYIGTGGHYRDQAG